ncbi:hypothetical protein BD779DRAFT_1671557 [Infundibulicybe gibba]|nr:hypothetical protein BD779DRAFT_1671557 [Infundibulicybe gibba]
MFAGSLFHGTSPFRLCHALWSRPTSGMPPTALLSYMHAAFTVAPPFTLAHPMKRPQHQAPIWLRLHPPSSTHLQLIIFAPTLHTTSVVMAHRPHYPHVRQFCRVLLQCCLLFRPALPLHPRCVALGRSQVPSHARPGSGHHP